MTLWILLAVMGILAVMFVVYPLYRKKQNFTLTIALAVLVVSGLSVGLYGVMGSPGLPSSSGDSMSPDMEEMVASLAERLESEPNDLNGWKMLGRTYMTLGDYTDAITAFEKAVELESSRNAQTLVELGSAILSSDGASNGVSGRSAALFESALALEPNNPQALFYGGIGAINRGDNELAASRWEKLLGLNPPEEIQGVLRQRVAEWRGQAMPDQAGESAPSAPQAVPLEQEGTLVHLALSLSDSVDASLPGNLTVYVIARDPAQPSPPIAVVRRRLSELPVVINLSDANSMVPGRSLSGFPEFEIVARISLTGQPAQQAGDWFASAIVRPADNNQLTLSIDTLVR
jgi:cytochrome c-type biogenesis protein CcmH